MTRVKIGVVALLIFVSTFAINLKPSWADGTWTGDVNFSIAAGRGRHLTGATLTSDAKDQTAFGADLIFGQNSWPAQILIGYSRSTRSEDYTDYGGTSFDATVKQFDVGVCYKNTASDIIRPYVAGGLASVTADVTQGSSSDTASSMGLFGRLGILFRVSDQINVGLEHRILTGTSGKLFGIPTDADYTQTSFVFGVGF